MYFIAHRGNLNGSLPEKENHPEYIQTALDIGFDVEIDVWYIIGQWYLGHDSPQYRIDFEFLLHPKLWLHAKDLVTLGELLKYSNRLHIFSHSVDPVVLTSRAIPWVYPGYPINKSTICVMPEKVGHIYSIDQLKQCAGICSDYIINYYNICK